MTKRSRTKVPALRNKGPTLEMRELEEAERMELAPVAVKTVYWLVPLPVSEQGRALSRAEFEEVIQNCRVPLRHEDDGSRGRDGAWHRACLAAAELSQVGGIARVKVLKAEEQTIVRPQGTYEDGRATR